MRCYDGSIIDSTNGSRFAPRTCVSLISPTEGAVCVLKNIVQLLRCVRLGLLTTSFFVEKVKAHRYIVNNEACRPLVIDTLKYLYELDVDVHRVWLCPINSVSLSVVSERRIC